MEATQAAPYTLKVKLGIGEFDGTGPTELIREDYDRWLQLMEKIASQNTNGKPQPSTHAQANDPSSETPDPIEAVWDRAFMRKDDKLSLHVLPDSKTPSSDSLLIILYGYQTWLGLDAVRSVDLMDSALQSGLRLDRIDRNLTPQHRKLIIKGGSGKGTRYSLNNRGLRVAQELLEKLFE